MAIFGQCSPARFETSDWNDPAMDIYDEHDKHA